MNLHRIIIVTNFTNSNTIKSLNNALNELKFRTADNLEHIQNYIIICIFVNLTIGTF